MSGRTTNPAQWTKPLKNYQVTSDYGPRSSPTKKASSNHRGIDLAAPTGTPIYAPADGVVDIRSTNAQTGGGLSLRIDHGRSGNDTFQTGYAHLSKFNVTDGQTVRQGDIIGYVGNTGESTGPHLHYTVLVNGQYVDPEQYLEGRPRPSAAGTRNQPGEETSSENPGEEQDAAPTEAAFAGIYAPSSQKNSLNRYRSYTYNFTFGVVTVEAQRSRSLELLERSIQDHCVFDTSGKVKNGGIKTVTTGTNLQQRQQLVQGFNENSSGAYDFYVEEVTIENKLQGNPTPTKVEMTIREPYSINGLYEALHTAAISAGYEKYVDTPFCLKIQFKGYRDDNDEHPEIIPNTTRYVMMKLTSFEMSVNEEGAKYKCLATPDSDQSFGTPNRQLNKIAVKGETVFEVLKSYFKALNESSKTDAQRKSGPDADIAYDRYEISAPLKATLGTPEDVTSSLILGVNPEVDPPVAGPQHNDIVKARIIQNIAQNGKMSTDPSVIVAAYDAIPANESSPQAERATPTTPEFSFEEGQQIHEAINAIILNSEYVRTDVLRRQLPAAKNSNSTITYFKIRMEVDLQASTPDPHTNRLTRVHRYIIEPYSISYTTMPPYDRGTDTFSPLMKQVRRTYFFTYTGKNTDVLKFDLKLDTLFYNALPTSFANADEAHAARGTPAAAAPANPDQTNLPRQTAEDQANANGLANHRIATVSLASAGSNITTAGLLQTDPYHLMAKALHENYLNKTYSNSKIDMDIIGDPYFLVTSHTRNHNLELSAGFETVGGEAPITQGEVYVLILMQGIKDISKNSEPSLAVIRENNYSAWSGLYAIDGVLNKFKEGQFTQTLSLRKVNGHVLDSPGTPAADLITRPSAVPGSMVAEDTADPSVNTVGKASNGMDLVNLIGRGVAGIGAALGVVDAVQAVFLTRESGTTDVSRSQLGVNSSIDQRSGIVNVNLSPSLLNSELVSDTAAAVGMAGTIMSQVANANNASVNLAEELTNAVPEISNSLKQEVESLPRNSLTDVGNAPSEIEILQNPILTDPTGTASRLGIEPAKIAGLSQNLASKVTEQLNEITEILPPNVNLSGLESQGLVFKNMSKSDLANLPALQPSARVLPVADDPAIAPIVDSFGSVEPLLGGLTNLSPLTENSKITNSMGYASSAISTNETPFPQSMIDKVDTAQRLVNDVSASAYGVPTNSRIRNNNALTSPSMSELGLGSKESNYASVSSLVQSNSRDTSKQLGMTLAAQFGSRATSSPLTTLIQKTNIRERNI